MNRQLMKMLFFAAVMLTATAARGQDLSMYVYPASGGEAEQTPLNEVRKLTFENENVLLHSLNGDVTTYAVAGVRKITFGAQTTVSIDKVAPDFELKLYPQGSEVFVLASTVEIQSLRVFGLTGVQLFGSNPNATEVNIPVGAYSPGVYIARVETSKGVITRKFVVTHQ